MTTPALQRRYAVIDLASAPALIHHVTGHLKTQAVPLLSPDLHIDILAVGPWLALLHALPGLERIIERDCADRPWGYFVETSVDIVSLRQTLRRFNLVDVPEFNQPVLFRYWDPRVMQTFLRVATQDQKTRFFEFIDRVEGTCPAFVHDVRQDA